MILDASTLAAYFDAGAEGHWQVAGEIEFVAEFEPLVVSPFVVAELEPVIRGKFGQEGWLAVTGGACWRRVDDRGGRRRAPRGHACMA